MGNNFKVFAFMLSPESNLIMFTNYSLYIFQFCAKTHVMYIYHVFVGKAMY